MKKIGNYRGALICVILVVALQINGLVNAEDACSGFKVTVYSDQTCTKAFEAPDDAKNDGDAQKEDDAKKEDDAQKVDETKKAV